MNNKKLVLFDKGKDKDNIQIGRVSVFDSETKKLKFRKFNKVILAGSAFTASKHFNIKPKVFTPSYNEVLGLDHSIKEPFTDVGIRKEEQIFLFAVGVGGCGQEASQVYKVDYTKWIQPEDLVPFRYQLKSNDLGNFMRDKYFGRKTTDDRIAYYFKAFENPPEFIQQYVDGTPIDENIYLSDRTDEVESFVQLNLKITKDDCRDFFLATTGINSAKINTISLLTAWKKEIDGHIYYQDIRPITKINFPNESLIDISKGIDIIYDIFY